MTRARTGARVVRPVRSVLPLCALLLALAPGRPARGERPPEDKDAEQRRALAGLGEKDKGPAPGEEAPEAEAGEPAALAPDRYVVQKGDTLWGICDTYFHDPWRWPKVWALNPDVTNPHWIFPGQTLHIGGITQVAPGEEVSAAAAPNEATVVTTRLPPLRSQRSPGNGAMREVGFVDSQELAFAGTVTGSREEKIMLATGDQVYIEFSKNRVPKAGQRFSIYQVDLDHPVKEPQSRAVLGYLVRVFGDVTVDALNDGVIADRDAAGADPAGRARLPGRAAVPSVQADEAPPQHRRGHGARRGGGAAQSADRRGDARGA